jgi:hypothetical protein
LNHLQKKWKKNLGKRFNNDSMRKFKRRTTMIEERYETLRRFLDEISVVGMPKTRSGVELRILKKLFTPEEADAVVYLRNVPDPVEVIADRMCKSREAVTSMLKQMAEHCVIRAFPKEDGIYYEAIPFAPGLLELSVRNADKEYAQDYMAYLDEAFGEGMVKAGKFPISRTIPIAEAVISGKKVMAYEQISEIIQKGARPRAVQNCWCREIKERAGEHCEKNVTKEVCIFFGAFAQDIIDSKQGREIDDAEFKKIMATANEAGLVPMVALNTSSFEDILNLCNCCSCCCAYSQACLNVTLVILRVARLRPVISPTLMKISVTVADFVSIGARCPLLLLKKTAFRKSYRDVASVVVYAQPFVLPSLLH